MKIQFRSTNVVFLRGGLRVQQTEPEDPATTPSVEFVKSSVAPNNNKAASFATGFSQFQRRRVVQFDESANQSYTNTTICQEECADLWYSQRDISHMRRQNRNHIRDLRQLECMSADEPLSWAKTYSYIYRRCCAVQSDEGGNTLTKDQAIINACHETLDIFTAGMEKRAIASVAADTAARRRQLWADVLHWQDSTICYNKPDLCAEMMRETSRQLSRPSCLYARHLALISAAVGDL